MKFVLTVETCNMFPVLTLTTKLLLVELTNYVTLFFPHDKLMPVFITSVLRMTVQLESAKRGINWCIGWNIISETHSRREGRVWSWSVVSEVLTVYVCDC